LNWLVDGATIGSLWQRKESGVFRSIVVAVVAAASLALASSAGAMPSDYVSPIFGLTTGKGGFLVADAGQGIVRVRSGEAALWAPLPGVADVDELDERAVWAITSGEDPDSKWVWKATPGRQIRVADLGAFEETNNPHPAMVDSNPFDIERLSHGRAVVADAAGNDLILVRRDGKLRLIAVLPDELVPTKNVKRLADCPNPPDPEFAFVCELPKKIPAEPVATSVVAHGGAYYVGELKGFPAPRHHSRVWRIDHDARGVDCATSPKCKVVVDGLTSIIDLAWYDGTLYAAQIDDASWLYAEFGQGIGGSVRACNPRTGTCEKVVSGQQWLTAISIRQSNGSIWGAINAVIPGQADVVRLRGPQ
jgi:hypothetical protein